MCVSTVLSVAATVGERLLYIELENGGMISVQSWENGKRDHLGLDRTETEEKVETNQRILPSDWCSGSNQHLDWSLGFLGPGRSLGSGSVRHWHSGSAMSQTSGA